MLWLKQIIKWVLDRLAPPLPPDAEADDEIIMVQPVILDIMNGDAAKRGADCVNDGGACVSLAMSGEPGRNRFARDESVLIGSIQ